MLYKRANSAQKIKLGHMPSAPEMPILGLVLIVDKDNQQKYTLLMNKELFA
ncbi:hypothetical protein KP78_05640 [Jeotgalibacillus soli]|uniref:Uncharacterized protein n=1 Tax=Jeotgalibacillus soli TaxID=889306 RepID=A0A0C2W833_9BACL|nr:hypothetical protein KP78_05640 [Jeotgalibacillus soli]